MKVTPHGESENETVELVLHLNTIRVRCNTMEEVQAVIGAWKDRGWDMRDPFIMRTTTKLVTVTERIDFEDGDL